MTASLVIMQASLSFIAKLVTISSNFHFLTDSLFSSRHYISFVLHHFCKHSSETKILCRQKLYTNWLKELLLQKSWISRKARILEKAVYDPHFPPTPHSAHYQLWKYFSSVVITNYRNQGQRLRNWEKDIGSQHCAKIILNIMKRQYSQSESHHKKQYR